MTLTRNIVLGLLLAVFVAFCNHQVRADAIDGEWCRAGKRIVINGPNIITPGGTRMIGNYDRHGFDYVVPPGEPGAGQNVVMNLWGEELMKLTQGDGPTEDWTRCPPATS